MSGMSKLRRVFWIGLLATLAMVLAACTAAGPAPAGGESAEAPAVEAEPGQASAAQSDLPAEPGRGTDGTVTLLFWQAVSVINPYLSTGTKDYLAGSLVLEPLSHYDAQANPAPVLAEEIPTLENGGISEDLTTITWTLKEGVLWADGTPLTAEDL